MVKTRMKADQRAAETLARLRRAYREARCALDHRDPWELLVATILSAQCTDVRVNLVTPELFRRFPDAAATAEADPEELEALVRPTGFYRNKARSILGAARRVVGEFGGRVPDTMDSLLTLPGVARKTANVVLGNAFGRNEGVVVDTHVQRLAGRIGLTAHVDPARVERDLMRLFPAAEWTMLSHRLIEHGRRVCSALRPRCAECVLGPDVCRAWEPDPQRWKAIRAKENGRRGSDAGKGRSTAAGPARRNTAERKPRATDC